MARKHLSHIKSKLTENGGPKLPTPSQLIEGEIAVNFAKGYETLSILNSNSGITTFSNDTTIMSYVDGQDMEIANAAGISAVTTSQGLTDYQYVATPNNPILSGATSLKNADELLSQTILDNEIVIARALNDINDIKLDASAYTPTDLSNYYNKQEVDAALSGKQDVLVSEVNIKSINGETLIGSGSVDADDVVMGKLENDEFYKVVSYTNLASDPVFDTNPVSKSEALNHEKIYVDILTNKAYRIKKSVQFGAIQFYELGVTDLSNYYNKTEIDTALSGKQDTLIAGTGIDITDNVVSSTLVIDSALDSGSTNPVQNSAITISLNEIEEVVGASLWDLNAKTVDNKRAISALTESLSGMQDCITTTYDELKTMRDGGTLSPGVWYRITDYQCTTSQANTSAATHQFDILVLATDTDKLSEEARAVNHSGDTYFSGSTLDAWKVWYCLDNDTSRFAWVDGGELIPDTLVVTQDDEEVSYIRRNGTKTVNGVTYYMWKLPEGLLTPNYLTEKEFPTEGDVFYSYTQAGVSLPPTAIGTVNSFIPEHIEEGNGRGVIYRLIDEWNNDCPYDFKNILFKRTITDGSYDEEGDDTWCYTLNVWHEDMCQDASVIGNTLINDENYVVGVYRNKFGTCTEFDVYGDTGNTLKFILGDNVVLTVDYGDEYYGCHSNTIGNSFYSNTIGNDFNSNTIGNNFNSNTIGNSFGYNTMGDGFFYNTIGNGFGSNTIGNGFGSNTIGNNFNSNTLGCGFGNSRIGNGFGSNTIGNDFGNNTIGNNFKGNTIGNYFDDNTIGNNFNYNTIGNNFNYNTIGTRTGSTATTIDYVRYIRVEDGVQFVNITTTATTSSSAYLQNITISQGIAGVSNNRKTITHPTVGDTFQTIYRPANSQVISV